VTTKKAYPGVYAAKALAAYADAIDRGLDADDLRMVRRGVAMAVCRLLDEGPLGEGWTAADINALATVDIGRWVDKLTSTSTLRVSELRLWARTCRSEVRARTRAAKGGA
jgi:hypothetical protein